ncbi:MAG: efflux RND transporter periplasmic adaptor subunit, partial [Flammeovirgaceae bacterium]|nr:efflux RND transporter periplasmic adaptor subunit [Flammeovirgaceae bacterium]MDW8287280.1 efflux RND transporter periplasmic adaptor subunit [Flammeovirgaceae bacterium]
DLQKVWIWLDAYETDLTWLRKGQRVRYRVHAFPDKELESTIAYISPFVHPDNRTVGIRLDINNEALRLKPEMFVTAQVYAQHPHTGQKSLIIPKTAVLWGGTVSVVYVKLPTELPTFEMREVVLGEALGNHYVVKEGLSEDEEVVVNGVFAIDATAQLQNKASLMNRNVKTIRQIAQITFKQFMDTATLERLSKITRSYFLLKDALVAADVHQAKKAAQQVVRLTENVALSSSLPEEGKKILAELLATLSLQAKNIVGNENIDAQRRYFIGLSEEIIRMVKTFGGVKEAYLQTCPMADNNKGASWLSLQREIRNPYYGKMMLTCGEVLEKIE